MTTKDVLALALEALEKSKSALAEELAAWDIDPPLHHVSEAHDLCDVAITAIKQAQEPVPPSDENIADAWISASDSDGITYDGPSFERGYRLGRGEYDEYTGALVADALNQAQQAQEPVPTRIAVTEDMHIAAAKVLLRADGLDGLPQRMMDAMLAAAPKQAEPAWQPIESAPKDGSEILLANPDGSCAVGWFKFRGHTTGWTDGDTFNMTWPTHWLPLPTPPEAKA